MEGKALGSKVPGFKPAVLSETNAKALTVWNMGGGQIEWSALPVLAELVGADDVESLVLGLLQIREYQSKG